MVGVGVLMLLVAWACAWQLWRRGELGVWSKRALVAMTFSGWVATLAGWYVTEIGRQPYLVYGVLTTAEAASAVPAAHVGATLIAYLLTYALLLVAYMRSLYYLAGKPLVTPLSTSVVARLPTHA